jgi:hypothetical protein
LPVRRLGWLAPHGQRRHHLHPQVLVGAGLRQLGGEPLGEGLLVEAVVFAGGQPRLDRGGGLLGAVGKHVGRAQHGESGFHELARGQGLGGQRGVIRHGDPGHGTGVACAIDGELKQPGRGEPQ